MDQERNSRTPWMLLGVVGIAEFSLGVGGNLVADVVRDDIPWLTAPLMWVALGAVFAVATVATAIVTRRDRHKAATGPGIVRTVVGALPGRPPDWVPPGPAVRELQAEGRRADRNSRATAVIGPSGAGKSHIVADYARQRAREGWVVIWVNASNPRVVELELSSAARRLGIAGSESGVRDGAEILRDHLQSAARPALIVFDGVADLEGVRGWIPSTGKNHVVLTSIRVAVRDLGNPIQLDGFGERQAHNYLRKRLPRASAKARRLLIEKVGLLPAVLWAASGVIRSERLSFDEYLRRFETEDLRVALHGGVGGEEPLPMRAVREAISSFATHGQPHLLRIAPMNFLAIAAHLTPVEIPPSFFGSTDSGDGNRVLASFVDWSLASWTNNHASVRLHDLPARLVRESMLVDDVAAVSGDFLTLVESALRTMHGAQTLGGKGETYTNLARLVEAHWEHVEPVLVRGEARRRLLEVRQAVAEGVFGEGDFASALSISESLVAASEPSSARPSTLLHLRALDLSAHAALATGRRERAVANYTVSVARHLARLGAADERSLRTRLGLANALRSDNRWAEAIELFRELLSEDLSPHLRSEAMGGLGFALIRAGAAQEAVEVLTEVVAERRHRVGRADLGTLIALNNLGHALIDLGDPSALAPLWEAYRENNAARSGHPQMLTSAHFLGVAEGRYGDRLRGEELLRYASAGRAVALGEDHPDTLDSKARLTELLEVE